MADDGRQHCSGQYSARSRQSDAAHSIYRTLAEGKASRLRLEPGPGRKWCRPVVSGRSINAYSPSPVVMAATLTTVSTATSDTTNITPDVARTRAVSPIAIVWTR